MCRNVHVKAFLIVALALTRGLVQAELQLVEDFEALTGESPDGQACSGALGGIWDTQSEGTGNIDLVTEDDSRNVALTGNSNGNERAIAFNGIINPIDDDEVGILFFRCKFRDSSRQVRTFVGLISDVSDNPANSASADDPLAMPVAIRWAGNPGEGMDVLTADGATVLKSGLARAQWYNIWLVVDNANDTFELYISTADGPTGGPSLPTEADLVVSLPFVTATTDSLVGMMISSPTGTSQAERLWFDEVYWDGDQGLGPPTKAHNPKPVNMAEGVLVDGAQLSWNTGTDPNDPNVPNPNIVAHYVWVSAPYDPVNPVIPDRWWREPGAQQFTIGADTSPADSQVDPNVVMDIPGLQRDKLYLWVVDEGLVGASGPEETDPSKIIWGNLWRFETETSGPIVDAGLNIVTWLDETTGKATATPDADVFDPSGDLDSITWSVDSPPADPDVTILTPGVEDPTVEIAVTGTFTLRVVATDLAGNPPGEDTMEIRVFADSCEAAQENPNGYDAPQGDLNDDCVVNLIDFAILASEWVEDRSLITNQTYE